jgi:hypothetical protein
MSESVDLIWRATDEVSPVLDSINSQLEDVQARMQFEDVFQGATKSINDLAQAVNMLNSFNEAQERQAESQRRAAYRLNEAIDEQAKKLAFAQDELRQQAMILKTAYSPKQLEEYYKIQGRIERRQKNLNELTKQQAALNKQLTSSTTKIAAALTAWQTQATAMVATAQTSFNLGLKIGDWAWGNVEARQIMSEEMERENKLHAKQLDLIKERWQVNQNIAELAGTSTAQQELELMLKKEMVTMEQTGNRLLEDLRQEQDKINMFNKEAIEMAKQKLRNHEGQIELLVEIAEKIKGEETAYERTNKQVKAKNAMLKFQQSLQEQISSIGESQFDRMRRHLEEMDDKDANRIRSANLLINQLERETEQYERQLKIEEMKQTAIEKNREARRSEQDEAKRLTDDAMTKQENFMAQVIKLNDMKRRGLIDETTLQRQLANARNQVGTGSAGQTISGSDDRFLTGAGIQAQDKQLEIAKKQLREQERQATAVVQVKESIDQVQQTITGLIDQFNVL